MDSLAPVIGQTYTLEQAKLELALQQCRNHGHDFSVHQIRSESGRVIPTFMTCSRCDESWTVGAIRSE